jgi:O-antigen ligase
MSPLRDRPTSDVIVLFLAGIVGFVIVFATIGLAIGLAIGKSPDIGTIAKAISDMTNSLIALIVGYIAGRGVNGNGNGHGPKPPDQQG